MISFITEKFDETSLPEKVILWSLKYGKYY